MTPRTCLAAGGAISVADRLLPGGPDRASGQLSGGDHWRWCAATWCHSDGPYAAEMMT